MKAIRRPSDFSLDCLSAGRTPDVIAPLTSGSSLERHLATGGRGARSAGFWEIAFGWVCALGLVSCLACACAGCSSGTKTSPDAGIVDADISDAAASVDPCDIDAFTGVGTACRAPSPVVCFPLCEAGGCSCDETPDGPRWSCVTDLSCQPACAPTDDACAAEAGTSDAGTTDAALADAPSE